MESTCATFRIQSRSYLFTHALLLQAHSLKKKKTLDDDDVDDKNASDNEGDMAKAIDGDIH